MELKDFIKQSLYDICMGISEAREEIYKEISNVPIAPHKFNDKEMSDLQREIEFDIAITVLDKTDKSVDSNLKTGGVIKVVGTDFVIGGSLGSEKKAESTNRIKFKIPFFPAATIKPKK